MRLHLAIEMGGKLAQKADRRLLMEIGLFGGGMTPVLAAEYLAGPIAALHMAGRIVLSECLARFQFRNAVGADILKQQRLAPIADRQPCAQFNIYRRPDGRAYRRANDLCRHVSTGAADDLQRATEIAVEMVTKYGMEDAIGQRSYMPKPGSFLPAAQNQVFNASEATAREIDLAVRGLLETGTATARGILEKDRADLEAGVAPLLSKETITADEFAPLRALAAAA